MTPHIPDHKDLPEAFTRTTHLGIGAHQDDLEFMAYHGIVTCYQEPSNWFTGITCTDGGGSPRTGPFADHTDADIKELRHREQIQAADLGQYAAQFQLAHSSSHLKSPTGQSQLRDQLITLLTQTTPQTVYTHNPADKHSTHLAVFSATIAALRALPKDQQPTTLLGCEVWRDLDWVPDARKVTLDVSPHPELAAQLNQVFQSQIAGGKNYHHALIGRRTAHATFSNPHASDTVTQVTFALDLMPLLEDPNLSPVALITELIDEFKNEVINSLQEIT
ncbi:MAG: PIG-L deacetylase family protein [Roseibacillus sp.]